MASNFTRRRRLSHHSPSDLTYSPLVLVRFLVLGLVVVLGPRSLLQCRCTLLPVRSCRTNVCARAFGQRRTGPNRAEQNRTEQNESPTGAACEARWARCAGRYARARRARVAMRRSRARRLSVYQTSITIARRAAPFHLRQLGAGRGGNQLAPARTARAPADRRRSDRPPARRTL